MSHGIFWLNRIHLNKCLIKKNEKQKYNDKNIKHYTWYYYIRKNIIHLLMMMVIIIHALYALEHSVSVDV